MPEECPSTAVVRGNALGPSNVFRSSSSFCADSTYSYLFRLFSSGVLTLRNVTVELDLPAAGVRVLEATPGLGQCQVTQGQSIVCEHPDVTSGQTTQWRFLMSFALPLEWNSTVEFPFRVSSTTCLEEPCVQTVDAVAITR